MVCFLLMEGVVGRPGEGGGGTPIWLNGRGCSSEILNETPKGDQSGRCPTVVWTLKKAILNFDYVNRVNKMNWKYTIFYQYIFYQYEIYSPKRDDKHFRPFHMGTPPPGGG